MRRHDRDGPYVLGGEQASQYQLGREDLDWDTGTTALPWRQAPFPSCTILIPSLTSTGPSNLILVFFERQSLLFTDVAEQQDEREHILLVS